MSHSTIYRICLLVVVVLTIIGGIFYYINYMENHTRVTEGTLVMEDAGEFEAEIPGEWYRGSEEREGISWQETQTQYI
ncbi:hypothetical protein D3Z36_09420 [Lachnospiraceae bacterium]|nr:hypothetical protein [Lachnospiraceae bacterium]